MEERRVPVRRAPQGSQNSQFKQGRWTIEEHQRYQDAEWTAMRLSWEEVARRVGTRSLQQCISHDQKFKSKVQNALREGYDGTDVALYAEHAMPSMDAIVARLGEINVRKLLPPASAARLFGAESTVDDSVLRTNDRAARDPRESTPPSLLLESSGVAQATPGGSSDSVGSVASRGIDAAWTSLDVDDLDFSSLFEVHMDALPLSDDDSDAAVLRSGTGFDASG